MVSIAQMASRNVNPPGTEIDYATNHILLLTNVCVSTPRKNRRIHTCNCSARRFGSVQCIHIEADVIVAIIIRIDIVQCHFQNFLNAIFIHFLPRRDETKWKRCKSRRLRNAHMQSINWLLARMERQRFTEPACFHHTLFCALSARTHIYIGPAATCTTPLSRIKWPTDSFCFHPSRMCSVRFVCIKSHLRRTLNFAFSNNSRLHLLSCHKRECCIFQRWAAHMDLSNVIQCTPHSSRKFCKMKWNWEKDRFIVRWYISIWFDWVIAFAMHDGAGEGCAFYALPSRPSSLVRFICIKIQNYRHSNRNSEWRRDGALTLL